jgi:hypothetical protein
MAFWMIAVGVAAAAQVGTTIAGGVMQEKYAKEGIEHQKKITLLNATGDVITATAQAPQAIPIYGR